MRKMTHKIRFYKMLLSALPALFQSREALAQSHTLHRILANSRKALLLPLEAKEVTAATPSSEKPASHT